jgi:hypothetical protein
MIDISQLHFSRAIQGRDNDASRPRIREYELKDNSGKRQGAEIIASRVQFLGSPPADARVAAEVNGNLASDEAPF